MSRKSFYKQSAHIENNSTTTTYEVEKPAHFSKSANLEPKGLTPKSRWLWWLMVSGIIFLMLSLVVSLGLGWWYWSHFETNAETRLIPIAQEFWVNRSVNLFEKRDYKTILLLGVDQSDKSRDNSMLTDTMILAIVRNDGKINLISIPRDLWIDSLKTKVNALYFYGQQTNPGDGVTLVSSVISEMTGVPVDYYFMINMDTLRNLVDALGGVDVEVAHSFEDKLYPREIDISSTDPAVLYETIRFEAGMQYMDGVTALKFIRSRHSEDEFEGTDEGRESRQQLLLSTLKKELSQPKIISDPDIMGGLYKVWKTSVKTNMSDLDIFLLAKQLSKQPVSVSSTLIPVKDGSSSGLIYHPIKGPSKQWVYMPVDSTWEPIHLWFEGQLKIK